MNDEKIKMVVDEELSVIAMNLQNKILDLIKNVIKDKNKNDQICITGLVMIGLLAMTGYICSKGDEKDQLELIDLICQDAKHYLIKVGNFNS